MPHNSDSKSFPIRTVNCSLGAAEQARLHSVPRNLGRAIITVVESGGSYSPRRHWCTPKPVNWEPGSGACVQIIGDVHSIVAIPFASLLLRSHLGPLWLDAQHYSCVFERIVPCESHNRRSEFLTFQYTTTGSAIGKRRGDQGGVIRYWPVRDGNGVTCVVAAAAGF